jgi:hypothetical protein
MRNTYFENTNDWREKKKGKGKEREKKQSI